MCKLKTNFQIINESLLSENFTQGFHSYKCCDNCLKFWLIMNEFILIGIKYEQVVRIN
jgi:hypothetical protein